VPGDVGRQAPAESLVGNRLGYTPGVALVCDAEHLWTRGCARSRGRVCLLEIDDRDSSAKEVSSLKRRKWSRIAGFSRREESAQRDQLRMIALLGMSG